MRFPFWQTLLLCCVIISGSLSAASDFEDGNRLFHEGKFADAETAYNRSLAKDGDAAATHHNLGKVREALADSAGAMLEWERALRLEPGHAAAKEALEITRANLGSKIKPVPWWVKLQPAFTRHRERWLVALCAWMAIVGGFAAAFYPSGRFWGAATAGLGLIASCWSGALLWHAHLEADMALVRDRSTTLRVAPADPARSLGTLPMGSRVRVLDTSAGWNRVTTAEGETGWLPAQSVERISPAQEH